MIRVVRYWNSEVVDAPSLELFNDQHGLVEDPRAGGMD